MSSLASIRARIAKLQRARGIGMPPRIVVVPFIATMVDADPVPHERAEPPPAHVRYVPIVPLPFCTFYDADGQLGRPVNAPDYPRDDDGTLASDPVIDEAELDFENVVPVRLRAVTEVRANDVVYQFDEPVSIERAEDVAYAIVTGNFDAI